MLIFTFLLTGGLFAQTLSKVESMDGPKLVGFVTDQGDTLPTVLLQEVVVPHYKNRQKYYRRLRKLTRNVIKTYPYAKVTGEILRDCEEQLAKIEDEKEKERFLEAVEESLKEEFEGELRELTISQGRVLINLVDRETGETSYELIKRMRGGVTAFVWQSFARLFGSNLKDEYDAEEEDIMIEFIIGKIERGELEVKERKRKTKIEYKPLELHASF